MNQTDNFTTRLKVETTYAPGDVRDHRDGFSQREYFRNLQDNPPETDGGGFQPNEVSDPGTQAKGRYQACTST